MKRTLFLFYKWGSRFVLFLIGSGVEGSLSQEYLMINRHMLVVAFFLLLPVGCMNRAGSVTDGRTKAAQCAECHGSEGISDNLMIPSLAGQRAAYSSNQLRAFKEASRKNPVMNAVAKKLSERDINDLAAYYASLSPMTAEGNAALAARGRVHYVFCQGCHGPMGIGPKDEPRLAGQHAEYLVDQLKAYRDGSREHPVMSGIAPALEDEDMRALAEFMATLK